MEKVTVMSCARPSDGRDKMIVPEKGPEGK